MLVSKRSLEAVLDTRCRPRSCQNQRQQFIAASNIERIASSGAAEHNHAQSRLNGSCCRRGFKPPRFPEEACGIVLNAG